ncbi:hypothetical protein Q3G72_034896 [Acer saccharum]|nr:hypothetical protein Q3G72_034896 [Acer saccharum]
MTEATTGSDYDNDDEISLFFFFFFFFFHGFWVVDKNKIRDFFLGKAMNLLGKPGKRVENETDCCDWLGRGFCSSDDDCCDLEISGLGIWVIVGEVVAV